METEIELFNFDNLLLCKFKDKTFFLKTGIISQIEIHMNSKEKILWSFMPVIFVLCSEVLANLALEKIHPPPTCRVSCVKCHVSHVPCHMSLFSSSFSFLQSGEAS